MTWRTGTWDWVKIDSQRLIGHVRKFHIAPTRNIESTPVPGLDGVDLRDMGYAGSPVTIEIEVIKSADFDKLAAQLANFNPRQPGVAIRPRAIEHPLARLANIKQVYILGYETDMPDDQGKWQTTINAFQFAKAKKVIPPLDGGSLKFGPNPTADPANLGAKFTG